MSDNNDPFAAFGSDRTVIKPSAGRAPRCRVGSSPGGSRTGAGRAATGGTRCAARRSMR